MPPAPEPSAWGFLTLVAWWNLYGLPALLTIVAISAALWHVRDHPPPIPAGPAEDREARRRLTRLATIRAISFIHVGIALRAAVGLIQEILTIRTQGIPQSFPITGLFLPAIAIPANLAIGHGLFRVRRWGRRAAIVWDALWAIVALAVVYWQWRYHAAVRLDQWPDYLVADVVPWILLALMLLPGTGRLFDAPRDAIGGANQPQAPPQAVRFTPLFVVAILLLLVVVSTLVIDATDWIVRSIEEAG
jgi:hypothetical protein